MASRSRTHPARTQRGAGDSAILAATRAIQREDDYRRSVNQIQGCANILAEYVVAGGEAERVFKEADVKNKGEEANSFLLSCRERLKTIAEGNAKRMYEIDYFVEAVKEVMADVKKHRQDQNEAVATAGSVLEDGAMEAPDYEALIHNAFEKIRERSEKDRLPIEYHECTIELRTKLGEKISKRSRASRGDENDDDDDDLEVVNNGTSDFHTLKCPITGLLFEDPVRNKLCHHTYSREGLNQLLNNRKKTCPVSGCANRSLSIAQVVDDEEMKIQVARYKAREEATRRKRVLEEEEDEPETSGYTVIQ